MSRVLPDDVVIAVIAQHDVGPGPLESDPVRSVDVCLKYSGPAPDPVSPQRGVARIHAEAGHTLEDGSPQWFGLCPEPFLKAGRDVELRQI